MITDFEATNQVNHENLLSKMALSSRKTKEIKEGEILNVLADKGYYKGEEIKICLDNQIMPWIPAPAFKMPVKNDVPDPEYFKDKFIYKEKEEEGEEDKYICPMNKELIYKKTVKMNGKMMRKYKGNECEECVCRDKCTTCEEGRSVYRWENENILEEMKLRVKDNKALMKRRQELSEHPFGTIKRGFDQGYMLMKGLEKVEGEISLSVLVYDIKRVINIVGVRVLIEELKRWRSNVIEKSLLFLLRVRNLEFWWRFFGRKGRKSPKNQTNSGSHTLGGRKLEGNTFNYLFFIVEPFPADGNYNRTGN